MKLRIEKQWGKTKTKISSLKKRTKLTKLQLNRPRKNKTQITKIRNEEVSIFSDFESLRFTSQRSIIKVILLNSQTCLRDPWIGTSEGEFI